MGWMFAIVFAALTLAALYRSGRMNRNALELAAVALLIGIVGYAWQGSPDVAGTPVASTARS